MTPSPSSPLPALHNSPVALAKRPSSRGDVSASPSGLPSAMKATSSSGGRPVAGTVTKSWGHGGDGSVGKSLSGVRFGAGSKAPVGLVAPLLPERPRHAVIISIAGYAINMLHTTALFVPEQRGNDMQETLKVSACGGGVVAAWLWQRLCGASAGVVSHVGCD